MDVDDTASAPGADDSTINRLLAILKEDDDSASPARAYGVAHALTQLGEPGVVTPMRSPAWGRWGEPRLRKWRGTQEPSIGQGGPRAKY